MIQKRLKRKLLKEKLFNKRRLIILNEDTFEETFSLKLTMMNVFVVATVSAILIITLTTFIIAFTPLREYIPGYASTELKRNATRLALKSDSLTIALQKNEAYINSIKRVLNNDLDFAKLSTDSITEGNSIDASDVEMEATKAEKELRMEVKKATQKKQKNKKK